MSNDRLQPALLDRLIDADPSVAVGSRERGVVSRLQLRDAVLRDLQRLFNASHSVPARDAPRNAYVDRSVIRYGLPDFLGASLSTESTEEIAQALTACIRAFEPRVDPDSLRVTPVVEQGGAVGCTLLFLVSGELWSHPNRQPLTFTTEFDLDAGTATVVRT